jgi:NADPH:quinone reductase-like Zn-dependent oxidoreductase
MRRAFFLVFLIALQIFSTLTASVSATSNADAQHRSLHAVLPSHHHDDQMKHEHDSLDMPAVKMEGESNNGDTVVNFVTDHHHHPDVNQALALLTEYPRLALTGLSVRIPRSPLEMHSAEQRAFLRPPRA